MVVVLPQKVLEIVRKYVEELQAQARTLYEQNEPVRRYVRIQKEIRQVTEMVLDGTKEPVVSSVVSITDEDCEKIAAFVWSRFAGKTVTSFALSKAIQKEANAVFGRELMQPERRRVLKLLLQTERVRVVQMNRRGRASHYHFKPKVKPSEGPIPRPDPEELRKAGLM
jgi:hypothetical protein